MLCIRREDTVTRLLRRTLSAEFTNPESLFYITTQFRPLLYALTLLQKIGLLTGKPLIRLLPIVI
jgi:hypothetical protein